MKTRERVMNKWEYERIRDSRYGEHNENRRERRRITNMIKGNIRCTNQNWKNGREEEEKEIFLPVLACH